LAEALTTTAPSAGAQNVEKNASAGLRQSGADTCQKAARGATGMHCRSPSPIPGSAWNRNRIAGLPGGHAEGWRAGPGLLEDHHFREKIFHFDHERIPERVVHARGFGAHGFFETYESLAGITRAEKGRVNYEPNSWGTTDGGPRESPERGFPSFPEEIAGNKQRLRPESFADHYSQARQFYISQTPTEQRHIQNALVLELSKCERPGIRARMVSHLRNIDEDMATAVAQGLRLKEMPEPASAAKPRQRTRAASSSARPAARQRSSRPAGSCASGSARRRRTRFAQPSTIGNSPATAPGSRSCAGVSMTVTCAAASPRLR
jgi:hypothetical protein